VWSRGVDWLNNVNTARWGRDESQVSESRVVCLSVCLSVCVCVCHCCCKTNRLSFNWLTHTRDAHRGTCSPMAAWWSTINNIIVSGEVILSVENSLKPLGGHAWTPLGSSQYSTRSPWRGLAALPRNPPPARTTHMTHGDDVFVVRISEVVWDGRSYDKTGRDQKTNLNLGLGLASLVLCCETRSCHARRHNDVEGHSNFSSTICSFSVLCLEHHYCGDQQWRLLI